MLNSLFAFGLPVFLGILFIGFLLLKKYSTLPFLSLILVIISSFLTVFSIQVIIQAQSESAHYNASMIQTIYGYPKEWLYITPFIGLLLLIISLRLLYNEWHTR